MSGGDTSKLCGGVEWVAEIHDIMRAPVTQGGNPLTGDITFPRGPRVLIEILCSQRSPESGLTSYAHVEVGLESIVHELIRIRFYSHTSAGTAGSPESGQVYTKGSAIAAPGPTPTHIIHA